MADETVRPLEPTPAAEWSKPFEEYGTEVLPSGRVCTIRLVNPTEELLAGTLPNLLIDWLHFRKPWGLPDPAPADKVATHYEGLLQLAARILVFPVLVLRGEDEPPPDPAKGEIGPSALTPDDLTHLRAIGLWTRLPEVQDAPFLGQGIDTGGTGEALEPDAPDPTE